MKLVNGTEINVIDQIQINGKSYFLVDLGNSKVVGGVLVKYFVCPTSQFNKTGHVKDMVETVA